MKCFLYLRPLHEFTMSMSVSQFGHIVLSQAKKVFNEIRYKEHACYSVLIIKSRTAIKHI